MSGSLAGPRGLEAAKVDKPIGALLQGFRESLRMDLELSRDTIEDYARLPKMLLRETYNPLPEIAAADIHPYLGKVKDPVKESHKGSQCPTIVGVRECADIRASPSS